MRRRNMIKVPLPFTLPKKKPKSPQIEQRRQRRKYMTLVAALSGLNGVVMFADTEETVAGYSKRIVEKLSVYDLPNMPFRFAIGGATTNAPYVDMLQSEIASTLSSINRYDLQEITNTLASTLTDFYSKHVWP